MVHRVTILVEHLQIVGLRRILADFAIPPAHAFAVHLGAPTHGTAIIAEGGVGGLARWTVVNAVDARILINLVALIVKQTIDGRQGWRVEGDGATSAIFVLHLAIQIRCRNFKASGIADAEATLLRAFLGGDEHHAIAATRAIKGCRRGTFQDVEALDVLLVDVIEGRTPVATATPIGEATFVGHRHSVDHDEGLVVAKDAVVTTDGDTRRATVYTVGVDDLHTRRATTQRADDAT